MPHGMRSSTSSALTSTVTSRAALTARKTGRTGKAAPSRRPLRVAASGESEVFRAWDQATKSQKRTDIKKIMILGAGPIVIGQVRARELARWGRRRGGDGGRVGPGGSRSRGGFYFETRRLVFFENFSTQTGRLGRIAGRVDGGEGRMRSGEMIVGDRERFNARLKRERMTDGDFFWNPAGVRV